MANSPENGDVLWQAGEVAEQAWRESNRRDYDVILPTNVIWYLENDMRLVLLQGMYVPDEQEAATVAEKVQAGDMLDEREQVVLTTAKLRTVLPRSEQTGRIMREAETLNTPMAVGLNLDDMDAINAYLDSEIKYNSETLTTFFTQHLVGIQADETVEHIRGAWRQVNLQGKSAAYSLLRIVNTAFLKAKAPIRPGFQKHFEQSTEDGNTGDS